MRPLRVMITSGGGPGVWGLLHALRHMPAREATLLVSDPAREITLGTALADERVRLPYAHEPTYVADLLTFCEEKAVEVLIPVYDGELLAIAQRRESFEATGTRVLLPPTEVVAGCVDKWRTHERLAETEFLPSHALVSTAEETLHAIHGLGYPRRRVCAKPVDRTGGRGFHILDADVDRFAERMFGKPGPFRCTLEEFQAIRRHGPDDFRMIVAEFLDGEELGIDLLAEDGGVIEMVMRRKDGPVLHGNPARIVFSEQPGERDWVERLAREMRLSGLFAIDARYDAAKRLRLLEINARPGAYVGMSCARIHLLAWAIDALLNDGGLASSDYCTNLATGSAMRVFADVIETADGPRVLDIRHESSEAEPHARALACSPSG